MTETPQAYTQRILAYAKGQDPLAVLASTPTRLAALVSTIPEPRLAHRPGPDKWSVREILAHLVDIELVVGYRVRLILQTDGVAIQSFDQDQWAAIGQYGTILASRSLERLRAQRDANVGLLRTLTTGQRARHGVHAERGPETVAHIEALWAGHDINHYQQVERILSEGPRPTSRQPGVP
jgi:hypothetical protein